MNIEQTVSAAVAGLQLGNTFTFDDLLRSVQDQRHRRLRVIELANLDTHDGLCALWLATDTDDLVLHARTDSTLHRQQFVLHELAHMILGHCEGDDCTVDGALLPNIPPYTRATPPQAARPRQRNRDRRRVPRRPARRRHPRIGVRRSRPSRRYSDDPDARRDAHVGARGEPAHLPPQTHRPKHHLRRPHHRHRDDAERRWHLHGRRSAPRRHEHRDADRGRSPYGRALLPRAGRHEDRRVPAQARPRRRERARPARRATRDHRIVPVHRPRHHHHTSS